MKNTKHTVSLSILAAWKPSAVVARRRTWGVYRMVEKKKCPVMKSFSENREQYGRLFVFLQKTFRIIGRVPISIL